MRVSCCLTLIVSFLVLSPLPATAQGRDDDFPDFDELDLKGGGPDKAFQADERRSPRLDDTPLRPRNSSGDALPDNVLPPATNQPTPQQLSPLDSGVEPGKQGSSTRVISRPRLQDEAPIPAFDWQKKRTSIADLRFPTFPNSDISTATAFDHGKAILTDPEEQAYLDLLDAVETQRAALLREAADTGKNSAKAQGRWETAFYKYAAARRLAWESGHLRSRAGQRAIDGKPNPFQQAVSDNYDLLMDINLFPGEFMGRPVALYGIYKPHSKVMLGDTQEESARTFAPEGGFRNRRRPVAVTRGTLMGMDGREIIATVDTQGLDSPQDLDTGNAVRVLVKGWVVKQWDGHPLIYCQSLRHLGALPHRDLITANAIDRHRLHQSETWLYYETIRQLDAVPADLQRKAAGLQIARRLDTLMREIDEQTKKETEAAAVRLEKKQITETEYSRIVAALKRRLIGLVKRYREQKEKPEEFRAYVDMHFNPDEWQGQMVTLRGHVRRVVSYPGDKDQFQGQMLHELWLFTDDSQKNPAVIVTTELPPEFPLDAEVVDRVIATGCVFKRYVYGSRGVKEQADGEMQVVNVPRVAPLILAGEVTWNPTPSQIRAMVADGVLSDESDIAVEVAQLPEDGLVRVLSWILTGSVLLVIMVLWGRNQREERERVRLRKRVDEIPQFQEQSDLLEEALPGQPGDLAP